MLLDRLMLRRMLQPGAPTKPTCQRSFAPRATMPR